MKDSAVPGWTLDQAFLRDGAWEMHRAQETATGTRRLVRLFVGDTQQYGAARRRLEAELVTLQALTGANILHPQSLCESATPGLFYEDFTGMGLRAAMAQGPMSANRLVNIAANLAEALRSVHGKGVVHRALSPDTVLYDAPSERLRLTGFNNIVQVSRHQASAQAADIPAERAAYSSPEQTGRMNRSVDYRSDFYNLGILLFELATGAPPFSGKDVMQVIYAHLAHVPPRVDALRPNMPPVVADIIAMLLRKNAEDRYQSAFALLNDFKRCQTALIEGESIAPFAIAQGDVALTLSVPEKLYGRAQEVAALQAAFEKASTGPAGLCLLAGPAGIGKSALVNELYKPVTRTGGYLVAAKFDQNRRDVPYAGIATAIGNVLQIIASEPTEKLTQWKTVLKAALGVNGGVLATVIPGIETLLGPQTAGPQVNAQEAQNRFNTVFQKFVGALARPEHPLVMFLDDLQWADQPSLKLLEVLLASASTPHLLVVGAYRDNEVSAGQPLDTLLVDLKKRAVDVHTVQVPPLGDAALVALLVDVFRRDANDVNKLAMLMRERTGGNPFFVLQVLQEMTQQGNAAYNESTGRWEWNDAAIRAMGTTSNILELVMGRLRELSAPATQLLKWAAVVGSSFDVPLVASVCELDAAAFLRALREVIDAQFVLVLHGVDHIAGGLPEHNVETGVVVCKFVHDRVQQAASALIDATQLPRMHLSVGRMMRQNLTQATLFEVVAQLNAGVSLMDPAEQLQLLQLNVQAGQRANASVAYQTAVVLFQTALQALPNAAWQQHYDIALALHLGLGEAAGGVQQYPLAERALNEVLAQARSTADKIPAYMLISDQKFLQFKFADSLALLGQALAMLGEKMPKALGPALGRQLVELLVRLPNDVRTLLNAPAATEERIKLISAVGYKAVPTAFQTNPKLAIYMAMRRSNLALVHGITPEVGHAFLVASMALGSMLGRHNTVYELGRVAVELSNRQPGPWQVPIYFAAAFGTVAWRRHARECLPLFRESVRLGYQYGNVINRTWGTMFAAMMRIMMGDPLADMVEDSDRIAQLFRNELPVAGIVPQATGNFARTLMGAEGAEPWSVVGMGVSAEGFERSLVPTGGWQALWLVVLQARLAIIKRDWAAAYALTSRGKAFLAASTAMLKTAEHCFLHGLACCGRINDVPTERAALLKQAKACHRKLATWAKSCEDNFLHKACLLQAEIMRLTGNNHAGDVYDAAVAQAEKHGYINNAALSSECAAYYHRARGAAKLMRLYARDALDAYAAWGATRKVEMIAQEFELTAPTQAVAAGVGLDLAAMIKASQAMAAEVRELHLTENVVRAVVENVGAQKGALVLRTGDAWRVWSITDADRSYLVHGQSLEDCAALLPVAALRAAIAQGTALVANQEADFKRLQIDAYMQQQHPQSMLCVPMLHRAEMIGLMYLENRLVAHAFAPERVDLVRLLAANAAISITNLHHHQELEARVQQRTHELRETQQRLLELQKGSTERRLAGAFAHEVRNFLGGAKYGLAAIMNSKAAENGTGPSMFVVTATHAKNLHDRVIGIIPEELRSAVRNDTKQMIQLAKRGDERCEIAVKSVDRVMKLTQEIFDYAKVGELPPKEDAVPLSALLDDLASQYADDLSIHNTALLVQLQHRESVATGGEDHYYQVFNNLLRNARDAVATVPDRPHAIHITDRLSDGFYAIEVQDNGEGIPRENYEKIFDAFFSTKPETGTGLGLGIVKKIVETYRLQLDFTSEVGTGTTFSVKFPRDKVRLKG